MSLCALPTKPMDSLQSYMQKQPVPLASKTSQDPIALLELGEMGCAWFVWGTAQEPGEQLQPSSWGHLRKSWAAWGNSPRVQPVNNRHHLGCLAGNSSSQTAATKQLLQSDWQWFLHRSLHPNAEHPEQPLFSVRHWHTHHLLDKNHPPKFQKTPYLNRGYFYVEISVSALLL